MRALTVPLLALCLLALGSSCSGSKSTQAVVIDPLPGAGRVGLPELRSLPSGRGLPLRSSSSETMELLDSLPILNSPGATAAAGSLSLNPAQNSGLAWAIYELYDFPDDGSVVPESLNLTASSDCYASVSNYSQEVWNHFHIADSTAQELGGAFTYTDGNGSIFVAVIATAAAANVSSLTVQVSGPLENAGYNEHEDNDKNTDANPLPAFPFSGYLGSLGAEGYDGDSTDYFSFEAAEGDMLDLNMDYEPLSSNFSLTIFKPGGSSTLYDDSDGNPGSRRIHLGLKEGLYVFRARALSGAGDYALSATLTPSGLGELEDNDSSSQANVLGPSLSVTGSVGVDSYDGDDKDYFSFTAEEGDNVNLTLTYNQSLGNLSLALLDTGGNTIYKDSAANLGLRSLDWGLHAGTTYALVECESGVGDYSLDVTLTPSGLDEVEDNDSFATAQPLPALPLAQWSGSAGEFGYDGDNLDYFSIPTEAGDIVTANLSYDNAGGNLSFTLYDADHSQAQKDGAGNPGVRGLSWGVRGGPSYLLVQSVTGGSGYQLDISVAHPGYQEVEENDSLASANVVETFPLSSLLGSLGAGGYDGDTVDYFTFTAEDHDLFSFSQNYDSSGATMSLVLLDGQNSTIYADSSGNPGTRSFDWGLKAGNYYLKLQSSSGMSNYSLDISRSPQSLDELEDNDDRPGAQLLSLPVVAYLGHCGDFGYDGDSDDYFFWNQNEPEPFIASLNYTLADGTVKFYLLDGTGTTVDSDTAGNPGVRSLSANLGLGTYYLRVQCSAGGSDYSMDAGTTP